MLTGLTLGLTVGLILALTGAGGGILAVPLLVFGTGASVSEAGPVGLMAVGMAAALGAVLGLRSGIVRYRAAVLIAATGMLLSPAGLWAARQVDSRWLAVLFGLVLLYVALKTFRQASGKNTIATSVNVVCKRDGGSGHLDWALALPFSAGALAGMLGGRSLASRLAGPSYKKVLQPSPPLSPLR